MLKREKADNRSVRTLDVLGCLNDIHGDEASKFLAGTYLASVGQESGKCTSDMLPQG